MDLSFLLLLSVLLLILLQSAYTFFLRNESFLCYKYSSLITIIVLILKYTLSEDNTDTQHSFENNLHNNTNTHFIALHRFLRFLQIKVKILHQPKEYDFLHFDTCFTWWSGINLQNLWGMSVPFSSFDFYLYLYIKSIKIAYRQYIVESCF